MKEEIIDLNQRIERLEKERDEIVQMVDKFKGLDQQILKLKYIDDVTANLVATGLKFNNVMYSSFDSNRDGASSELFEKFITQPIYDEDQWKTLSTGNGGGQ